MAGSNGFLPFAFGASANVLTDAAYQSALAANGQYANGVVQGQASSQQANKTWLQGTLMAAVLGQIIADMGQNASDSQSIATLEQNLIAALRRSSLVLPYDGSFANKVGGYPSKTIVADPTTLGVFWVSTADNNLTTPGAQGASWVNLFAGLVANAGGNLGGIVNAGIDVPTGSPAFLDGKGNWHVVQPAGNYQAAGSYLVTNINTTQTVRGPVGFSGTTTAPTVANGDKSTNIATTAFATPGKLVSLASFISSSGTYTPPRQDKNLIFRIRAVAGGGGGASTPQMNAYEGASGGGGGSGSSFEGWFTWDQLFASGATNLWVGIGGGGTPGSAGGNTTVGAFITCYGGYAAGVANGGGYSTIGPPGGGGGMPSFSNGYRTLVFAGSGQCGQAGFCTNPQSGAYFYSLSGAGGNTQFGAGGGSVGAWQSGLFGNYGGGGGGACSNRATSGTSPAMTGGTGGWGMVFIEAYEALPY
ncbi:hypothetical protein [Asaia sp. VD9]|uniref:hypothetical protein n=1 Tax=Asaia sp. VD9 TaxID=3081235 RepID=UPI00301AFA80